MKKKILIADDHFVVRTGVGFILESEFKEFTIDFVESYTDLMEKLKLKEYDLLFLDINMPGSKYKLMINEIKGIQKDIKVLVFSAYDESTATQYIMEGADGYLNKLQSEEKIIEAVYSIFNSGYYYTSNIIQKLIQMTVKKESDNPFDKLSPREYQIFRYLIQGHGNLEISNELSIQMSTISTLKTRIYKKLKVKNIVDLMRLNEEYNERM